MNMLIMLTRLVTHFCSVPTFAMSWLMMWSEWFIKSKLCSNQFGGGDIDHTGAYTSGNCTGSTIGSFLGNSAVLAYFRPKAPPVLLHTGAYWCLISKHFIEFYPHVTLQCQQVNERLTCTYASLLETDGCVVIEFEVGGHYCVPLSLLCECLHCKLILGHDFCQTHNTTVNLEENGHIKLTHWHKLLYINNVQHSLI